MNPTGYIWNIAGMNRAGVPRRLRLRPSEFAELCRLPGFGGGGRGQLGTQSQACIFRLRLNRHGLPPAFLHRLSFMGGRGGEGRRQKQG